MRPASPLSSASICSASPGSSWKSNSEIRARDAGHFAWEQASDEYGRLIVEWVTGGFQRLGSAVRA
jgi:hypothetical protein